MSNIYQEIWDADQSTHGIPALRPGEPRDDARGWVLVDEKDPSPGEDHRVLPEMHIPESKSETYELCKALYNNYQLDPGIREQITRGESEEEAAFIERIVGLPPLQVARDFIASELGQPVSDSTLASMIRETWFQQGMSGSKHASGFEHVFIGEQKEKGNKPDDRPAEMGGYHFWHKYYLDDHAGFLGGDTIDYHSTVYRGTSEAHEGLLVADVVTLSFSWRAHDFVTGEEQLLNKPIGGFWVGPSPEGMIALGLVRCRTKASKIAEINGSEYQLDLHRLDGNPNMIRTFFPRFRRSFFIDIDPGEGGTGGGGAGGGTGGGTGGASGGGGTGGSDTTARTIRLIAALVNPSGHDAGRETVTLINTAAEAQDLENWAIVGPNGTRFVFADVVLAAGEVRTFRMPVAGAQLRNRAGDITLADASGGVHDRVSYSSDQANDQGVTIVF